MNRSVKIITFKHISTRSVASSILSIFSQHFSTVYAGYRPSSNSGVILQNFFSTLKTLNPALFQLISHLHLPAVTLNSTFSDIWVALRAKRAVFSRTLSRVKKCAPDAVMASTEKRENTSGLSELGDENEKLYANPRGRVEASKNETVSPCHG